MCFRPTIVACFAAALLLGASPAAAQSTLPLRGTVDDTATDPALNAPADGWNTVTTINALPVEEEPPPRRKKIVTDPYAPLGISAGGLRLLPSLTIGTVATSNLSKAPSPKADYGLSLRPALRIESDWVRHSYTADLDGDLVFYARNSDLNARGLNAAQRLRLDVRHDTTAELATSYTLSQSGQEDSNVPATAIGNQTEHTLLASAAVSHDFGGVEGRVKTSGTWHIYDDVALSGGGTQSNADREYVEPSVSIRATLTDPPVIKPYVELGYAPRIHARSTDRNGLKRDSTGLSASAGVVIDSGPIWSGDVALTYLHRSYEDAALDSNGVAGVTGSLTWSPTELTTIVTSLGTSISESTSATSAGARNWTIGLDATQAIRDNIDVTAGAGLEVSDASTGTDLTYDANLGLSWKLNPALSWTAGYDFTWLDAPGSTRDYTEHRLTAGMTLRH